MKPCKNCPFRAGSSLGYDADALEALDEGLEPSCHSMVGLDSIFAKADPGANRCHGHDQWRSGADGFRIPVEVA